MKKGRWNYTEDISYKVILVELLPEPEIKLHWQNALIGTTRQVVHIEDKTGYSFLIDNEDGSGLQKIYRGGGPDSYSAHVGNHKFIEDVPEENWNSYDYEKFKQNQINFDAWVKEKNPEEWENHQAMKRMVEMVQNRNFHVGKNGEILPGKKSHQP